jgi:RES domain-containing protein
MTRVALAYLPRPASPRPARSCPQPRRKHLTPFSRHPVLRPKPRLGVKNLWPQYAPGLALETHANPPGITPVAEEAVVGCSVAAERGVSFEGSLYRAVGPGHDPLLIHPGNISASHRFTAPGQGGLYFGSGGRIVEAEFVGNGSSLAGQQLHAFPNSSVNGLLDLTNPAVRQNLGVSLGDLTRTGGTRAWRYEVTQPLGAFAQKNGYNGIIAPSAQADGGLNVILFSAKGVK